MSVVGDEIPGNAALPWSDSTGNLKAGPVHYALVGP